MNRKKPLYEYQKSEEKQVQNQSLYQLLETILSKIEQKQHSFKSFFFMKLVKEYSSFDRVFISDQNDNSHYKPQLKSPDNRLRYNGFKRNSKSPIPKSQQSQQWKPSAQLISHIKQSFLGENGNDTRKTRYVELDKKLLEKENKSSALTIKIQNWDDKFQKDQNITFEIPFDIKKQQVQQNQSYEIEKFPLKNQFNNNQISLDSKQINDSKDYIISHSSKQEKEQNKLKQQQILSSINNKIPQNHDEDGEKIQQKLDSSLYKNQTQGNNIRKIEKKQSDYNYSIILTLQKFYMRNMREYFNKIKYYQSQMKTNSKFTKQIQSSPTKNIENINSQSQLFLQDSRNEKCNSAVCSPTFPNYTNDCSASKNETHMFLKNQSQSNHQYIHEKELSNRSNLNIQEMILDFCQSIDSKGFKREINDNPNLDSNNFEQEKKFPDINVIDDYNANNEQNNIIQYVSFEDKSKNIINENEQFNIINKKTELQQMIIEEQQNYQDIPYINTQNIIKIQNNHDDRDYRINKGMETLAQVLLKKKDMKQKNYMDLFVKYELFYCILTRVVNAVKARNLLFAFMNINSFGFSKHNKFDKLNYMINHFEEQLKLNKRQVFFQIQRAALKYQVIQGSAKKLLLLLEKKEEKQKKLAFHSIQSTFSVSRVFTKGKFSQYHFLAMKFQDILRKSYERRKRDALNQMMRFNLKYLSIQYFQKHNEQRKKYVAKQNYFSQWRKKFLNQQQRLKQIKILENLYNKRLFESLQQMMIYSKQVVTHEKKKLIILRSIIIMMRNKQKMFMQSAFQAFQKEKQSQMSKEKIKLVNQASKQLHDQQKLQRKRAIAYRMTGIFQKLTDQQKSDAFRKIVLQTFKSSEQQQKKLSKISKVFINILCSRYNKLCSDAFSQILCISNSNFLSQRLGIQALTRFLDKKMKENMKSSFFSLKNHRFISAYESKQRRTLSKSFYLMLSVKLKNVIQKRQTQYLAYSLKKIHEKNCQKLLLDKFINNIHIYHERQAFLRIQQSSNEQRILNRALCNIQKMQNSIQKDNLFSSWNRMLRNKHFKKQNVSKTIVLMITLQNLFKKCKSDTLQQLKSNNQSVKLKQRSARCLGQKLNMIEKNNLSITFQKLKKFAESKTKLIKRFVSILRTPYYSLMESTFKQLYDYDFDYYYYNKESRQYVTTRVQNYIQEDFRYISPLSKKQQQLQQDQVNNKTIQHGIKNSMSINKSQYQVGLNNSPSTDRTIKLDRTPFMFSTIKVQQSMMASEQEIEQRQRERYCYFSNILNRKSKIVTKRQVQNAFKNIQLVYQQQISLENIVENITKKQSQKYLQEAFKQMKAVDVKNKLAINFSNKLVKVVKQSALLPYYFHFFTILKENKMSQIYTETYRNLQISQQKKNALQISKQGQVQIMDDVLKKVKTISTKQKQLYAHFIYFIENAILNRKRIGLQSIKDECKRQKITQLVGHLNKQKQIQQRKNIQFTFEHVKNVGNILYRSKQLTFFSQKLSLFLSKKILQQKYEGLFSIREHSNNLLEIYNFYEVKKNTLAKIIIKQRQKHLLSSFFLWRRINKEFTIRKNMEQESINSDLYLEVLSFLNQRKNFENVIDHELKKIQNTASKTYFDSDKKSHIYDYRGQTSNRIKQQYNLNSSMKQNQSTRDNLDQNRSFKTTSSSFNVSTYFPESSGVYQKEKRYDSGDFIMDNYQYQLQSQKKQLYTQFIDQKVYNDPSPQVDNQFIACGIPIIEDEEDQPTYQQQEYNKQQYQVRDNQYNKNNKKVDKIVDKYYPEASAEFSFTELESSKY